MPMACNVANNEEFDLPPENALHQPRAEWQYLTQQAAGKRGISDVNERHNLSVIGEQIPPCSGGVITSGVFFAGQPALADVYW